MENQDINHFDEWDEHFTEGLPENTQNIRDLEQQAKGVMGYISSLDGNCEVKVYKSWIRKDGEMYAEQILNQARVLKQRDDERF